jgi:subtilase family serine protease
VSKRFLVALAGAGALAVTALTAGVTGAQAASPHLTHISGLHAQRACAAKPAAGFATCFAKGLMNKKGVIPYAAAPLSTAMTPDQIQAAYGLGSANAAGRTVAIVDAYGYPNLARDLATYRTYYGLGDCTTANGCLAIVDQNGGSSLPRFNLGWAQEQSLDVDAVSAACPSCDILVVQAKSANFTDLSAAVTTAAKHAGVVAISNSYGAGDLADTTYGAAYIQAAQAGKAVTASTGDNGYQGASFPASSRSVTAVGGTTLRMTGAGGLTRGSETAWSGAGSGCSTVNTAIAPSTQTGCAKRAISDVSAAADPNYGGLSTVSPTSSRNSSWSQWGGTSESSPIIAAVYALAGGNYSNTAPYAATSSLHDITSGSNGSCPAATPQWCTAGSGWDGPTGLGTPNGTGAF